MRFKAGAVQAGARRKSKGEIDGRSERKQKTWGQLMGEKRMLKTEGDGGR